MTSSRFLAVLLFLLPAETSGHGALTKPLPRKVLGQEYCPWCVGEHQPVTNPYGKVHYDAELSSPCMGSKPGDAPYTPDAYASYKSKAVPGEAAYVAGGKLNATIVLNADHNGEAQWSYCPHSESQTEECFRGRPLTGWVDVHSYWGGDSSQDHWKSDQTFPQTVMLPADMPAGPATLRWLWVCKWTDEIFVSCLDTEIVGGQTPPLTSAAPSTTAVSTNMPASSTTDQISSSECIWTEPAGREVQRTSREEKNGRICWDYVVQSGTTVYYQSKSDIYTHWNADTCCVHAASPFGSAQPNMDGEANVVSFTASTGSFGFCECTAWDPGNPGASCAGDATASNMICPVQGSTDGMCSTGGQGSAMDGIPIMCTPSPSQTTTAVTSAPSPATTTGISPSDAVFTTSKAGSAIDRLKEFVDSLTTQPVSNSQARAVHSSGGAAGGVVSEGQAYGMLIAGAALAAMDVQDANRLYTIDVAYSLFLGWRRMCELSATPSSCQQDEGFKCGGGSFPCLPHWKFGDDLTTVIGTGAAPDGDADALTGMLLAVLAVEGDNSRPDWYVEMAEWAYETCLQFYQSSTVDSPTGNHRIVKLGSCWGGWGSDGQNPSYHAPAAYRMCKRYMKSQDSNFGASSTEGDSYEKKWDEVIDTSYKVLTAVQCPSTGLITNWASVTESGDGQRLMAITGFSGSGTPAAEYGSEASRGTWRVALDYLFFPDEAASAAISFLSPVAKHLETKESAGNWADNLDIDESCLVNSIHSSWQWNMFMAGPTFASLVCPADMDSSRQQTVIDSAGARLASRSITDYYSGSWLAIATLTLNGDLLRAGKKLGFRGSTSPPSPFPTPVPVPAPVLQPYPTPSGPTSPTPSPAPAFSPTPTVDSGCCSWDAAKGCQDEGNTYCQVKENCLGSCNGKWLVLATATTTLLSRTAPLSSTASVASTTATSSRSTTISMAATTTLSSATTSATGTPTGFEVVNGGTDQACRASSPSDTSEAYYTLFAGMTNLKECAAECSASPSTCTGIEYNALSGRCEVWHEPIQATQQATGYSCHRYMSSPTSTAMPAHASCGQLFEQCGGDDVHYQGPQCCVSGLKCERLDASYSQCKKDDSSGYQCAQLHEQCAGADWTGPSCCAEGLHCVMGSRYYSQCLKQPGSLLQVHDGSSAGQLRGPRLRKSARQSSLESKPWFVQKGSRVTSLEATDMQQETSCSL